MFPGTRKGAQGRPVHFTHEVARLNEAALEVVTPDGQRFVMFPAASGTGRAEHPHVMLVTRWFDDLAKALPAGRN